jgi:hypothetical protein
MQIPQAVNHRCAACNGKAPYSLCGAIAQSQRLAELLGAKFPERVTELLSS